LGWIDILSKTDLGPPATALINRVSDAIGAVAGPVLKVADARAEVEAGKIRAVGRIEISDAEQLALSSFSRQWSKERERIASVLGKTASMLEDGDDPDAIDEDWLLLHLDRIRLVSDKEMEHLWAKILAGEARKPGSFSKRCLDFLSTFEKEEAQLFTSVCKFILEVNGERILTIFDWGIPIYTKEGVTLGSLSRLSAIGLLQFSPPTWNSSFTRIYKHPQIEVRYFGELRYFSYGANNPPLAPGGLPVNFGVAELTELGKQLSRIAGATAVSDFFDHVQKEWSLLQRDADLGLHKK
jgi:hypothetical protein